MIRACVIFLIAASACARGPSREDCARLFDHFLEVEGGAATDGKFVEMAPSMTAALAIEGDRQRARVGQDFIAQCTRDLSRAELDCAMTATSEAGMDDCERP